MTFFWEKYVYFASFEGRLSDMLIRESDIGEMRLIMLLKELPSRQFKRNSLFCLRSIIFIQDFDQNFSKNSLIKRKKWRIRTKIRHRKNHEMIQNH